MTIVEVLQELKIEFRSPGEHHHAREGWVQVCCPFCGDGGHFRLGINTLHAYASCWTCGPQYLQKALIELSGRPWQEVKGLLGGMETSRAPREKPTGTYQPPQGVGPLLGPHKRYLKSRGFDPEELSRVWGVKGIGMAARHAWRLFIPVVYRGKEVSWITRGLTDEGKRYVNASPEEEALPMKSTLLGGDFCRHAVVVVEGPFDAFRVGPGAAATMGLVVTPPQVLFLSRFPVRCVCFDSEWKAQDRARKLCQELSVFPGKTTRVELSSPDPGSASGKEIKQLRRLFLE